MVESQTRNLVCTNMCMLTCVLSPCKSVRGCQCVMFLPVPPGTDAVIKRKRERFLPHSIFDVRDVGVQRSQKVMTDTLIQF